MSKPGRGLTPGDVAGTSHEHGIASGRVAQGNCVDRQILRMRGGVSMHAASARRHFIYI